MNIKTIESQLELMNINATLDNMQIKPIQQSPPAIKQCRICLSADEKADPFISPCQCTGSMKYVHHSCLKQWLQVKVIRDEQHPEEDDTGVNCELCKQRIQVKMRIARTCNSADRIKGHIRSKTTLFLISIMGFILCLSLICYSIIQLAHQISGGYNNFSTVQRVVVIASLSLNIVLSLFFFYNLFGFFVSKKAEIWIAKTSAT